MNAFLLALVACQALMAMADEDLTWMDEETFNLTPEEFKERLARGWCPCWWPCGGGCGK